MAYKATIIQQNGKAYKIQVKQGNDVEILYRYFRGQDKINEELAAIEALFNDADKKANRDQQKQDKKDKKNIENVKKEVNKIINSLVFNIPKTANATQNKLDKLKSDLQSKIDTFIGSL